MGLAVTGCKGRGRNSHGWGGGVVEKAELQKERDAGDSFLDIRQQYQAAAIPYTLPRIETCALQLRFNHIYVWTTGCRLMFIRKYLGG